MISAEEKNLYSTRDRVTFRRIAILLLTTDY